MHGWRASMQHLEQLNVQSFAALWDLPALRGSYPQATMTSADFSFRLNKQGDLPR